jgi:chloride channel 3/4/5
MPILRADKAHTVRSLTGKLLELVRVGMADSGFPVLVKETVNADGRTFSAMRVVGFLGMNELEHALCEWCRPSPDRTGEGLTSSAAGRRTRCGLEPHAGRYGLPAGSSAQ